MLSYNKIESSHANRLVNNHARVVQFDRSSARFVSRDHLNLFTYRGKMMRSLVLCPPFLPYEYANQFNRAVGRSKKIIGAGRLFKIRGTANRQWFSALLKYLSAHSPRLVYLFTVTLNCLHTMTLIRLLIRIR